LSGREFMDGSETYRNLADVLFDAIQVLLDIFKHLEGGRGGRFRDGVCTRTGTNGVDGAKFWSMGSACHFPHRIRRGAWVVVLGDLRHLVVWRVFDVGFEVHVYLAAVYILHQADHKLLVVDWRTGRRGPGTDEAGFYDDVINGVFQIDGDRGHESRGGRRDAHVGVMSEDLCGPIRDDQLGVIIIINVDHLFCHGGGAGTGVLVFGLRLGL
jgi:hypothetical protein